MAHHHSKVIILGSGPAGYTAAIYAARSGLDPLLISGEHVGGQLTLTSEIENFPGFVDPITGPQLMEQMKQQALNLGTRFISDHITEVDFENKPFVLNSSNGNSYIADCVIIATGASVKWLNLESEKKFMGKGVSACAHCDGFFYKDKHVAVIGGGNSAVSEALHLTKFAKSVTLIHRRNKLKAEKVLIDKLMNNEKVNILWNCVADEILGQQEPFPAVTGLRLRNVNTDSTQEIKADGVFVAIGRHPNTEIFTNQLVLDKSGYIVTKLGCCQTSVEGVFAAGDVVSCPFKQAVVAAGMGCAAALEAGKYIENQK